jgi:hypothetical protein
MWRSRLRNIVTCGNSEIDLFLLSSSFFFSCTRAFHEKRFYYTMPYHIIPYSNDSADSKRAAWERRSNMHCMASSAMKYASNHFGIAFFALLSSLSPGSSIRLANCAHLPTWSLIAGFVVIMSLLYYTLHLRYTKPQLSFSAFCTYLLGLFYQHAGTLRCMDLWRFCFPARGRGRADMCPPWWK